MYFNFPNWVVTEPSTSLLHVDVPYIDIWIYSVGVVWCAENAAIRDVSWYSHIRFTQTHKQISRLSISSGLIWRLNYSCVCLRAIIELSSKMRNMRLSVLLLFRLKLPSLLAPFIDCFLSVTFRMYVLNLSPGSFHIHYTLWADAKGLYD